MIWGVRCRNEAAGHWQATDDFVAALCADCKSGLEEDGIDFDRETWYPVFAEQQAIDRRVARLGEGAFGG
jgi:hypothetical protein